MASDYMYSNVMCMGGKEGKRGGREGGACQEQTYAQGTFDTCNRVRSPVDIMLLFTNAAWS